MEGLIILFLTLAICLCVGLIYCLQKILFKGELIYLIYFLCFYLPFYATLQAIFFKYTGSTEIVYLVKYTKEILVLVSLISWLFYRKNIFTHPIKLSLPDYLFLAFVLYALVYTIIPIGPSNVGNKLIYFKNMLMLALMYLLGRIMILSKRDLLRLFRVIFSLSVLAFILNLIERSIEIHFQSFISYAQWNLVINGTEPSGYYDILYTFGNASAMRLAAFFANPLELSASMLLSFAAALAFYLNSRKRLERYKYGLLMALSIACLLFAYSRASVVGLFLMIFFIALILGYYKVILYGSLSILLFTVSIFVFADNDLRYFAIDSLNLADPSSASHVIEWIEGVDSMISNPFGIGLGTSGNAGGVDEDLKMGGENQFIIFGVQLGVPFLLLYISLIVTVITYSVRAYNRVNDLVDQVLPFVASTFKIAFLIPLFTSNAETFLYAAYISWWMCGQSVTLYLRSKE